MKTRENNLDLLRIISCFAVILIHVNAHFLSCSDSAYSTVTIIENIINTISRFSVPCFVMISGAFLLNSPKNKNYKSFYSKIFYKTAMPFLIFLSALFLFSFTKQILTHGSISELLISVLTGNFYNLWFMFMLFGLYALTPVIITFKESVSPKTFKNTTFVLLIFSVISQLTTVYTVPYSFGVIFSYLGYYMIGNVIYDNYRSNKNPVIYFSLSLLTASICVAYRHFTNNYTYAMNPYSSFFSPFILLSSVFLFIAFNNINIKKNLSKLSEKTFYIYLIHTFVYQLFFAVLNKVSLPLNEIIIIILVTLLTFFTCLIISTAYIKIWIRIETKCKLKEKWASCNCK